MRVYLIRHGAAEQRRAGADDSERELTADGAREVARVAKRLGKLGVAFDRLLTSPYARARQTAELLVEGGLAGTAERHEAMVPPGDFEAVLSMILAGRTAGAAAIALVGHEPTLSAWAGVLTCGRATGGITIRKGGIAAVEIPQRGPLPGHCALVCLTSPKLQ
jgi:phosphohistidine phosphatase